jgi:outer membrane receptor protein involved in Fe transport
LPNMPQYTLNVGGQYHFTLPAALSLTPRIDYNEYGRTSYQDFQNPNPNAYVYQPAYGTLDAQLALAGRGNWAITVYGKNLTSTHYVTSAFSRYSNRIVLVPLDVDLYQIAEGATVGVEARVTF